MEVISCEDNNNDFSISINLQTILLFNFMSLDSISCKKNLDIKKLSGHQYGNAEQFAAELPS